MALTVRQQMVKGSEWVASEDFKVLSLSKSDIEETTTYGTAPDYSRSITRTVKNAVYTEFKKGDKFVITNKMSTNFVKNNWRTILSGLFVDVEVSGSRNGSGTFEFKDISPNLTLTKSVVQELFV